ncbi:MAG: DUF4388 domain-containing protein, partial [Myxococcota bacterium]
MARDQDGGAARRPRELNAPRRRATRQSGLRLQAAPGRVAVSIGDVVSLLEEVEKAAANGTDALSIDGRERGRILVERGRVCWAVSERMHRRLSEILCAYAMMTQEVLDRVVAQCRETSTPLGEMLVASGLMSEEAFRQVLLQHTTEAIARLGAGRAVAFEPHRHARYDARFTFSPGELMTSVGSTLMPDAGQIGDDELANAFDDGSLGAAFAQLPKRQAVLPVAIRGEFAVAQLRTLGEWARDILATARRVDPHARLAWGRTASGKTALAWEASGIVVLGLAA